MELEQRLTQHQRSQLSKTIEIITESLDPLKIILFGSFARGTNHAQSDFDLCIVTNDYINNNLVENFKQKIAPTLPRPCSLIIDTASEYDEKKAIFSSIEFIIDFSGLIVYSKSPDPKMYKVT